MAFAFFLSLTSTLSLSLSVCVCITPSPLLCNFTVGFEAVRKGDRCLPSNMWCLHAAFPWPPAPPTPPTTVNTVLIPSHCSLNVHVGCGNLQDKTQAPRKRANALHYSQAWNSNNGVKELSRLHQPRGQRRIHIWRYLIFQNESLRLPEHPHYLSGELSRSWTWCLSKCICHMDCMKRNSLACCQGDNKSPLYKYLFL